MDEQLLLQLAGLFRTRARCPTRATRETRHMSSAPENGLVIFSSVVLSLSTCSFGPKPPAGARKLTLCAPAYVGVGGLGGAVLSAFLQTATRPLAASPLAASGGLYPAALGPQGSRSEPTGFAPPGIEGWPASNLLLLSAGLGAFLLIFSFVLGVIVGGCGGFCLGYLWGSAGRSAGQHYGWPRVAGYLRPPAAA